METRRFEVTPAALLPLSKYLPVFNFGDFGIFKRAADFMVHVSPPLGSKILLRSDRRFAACGFIDDPAPVIRCRRLGD